MMYEAITFGKEPYHAMHQPIEDDTSSGTISERTESTGSNNKEKVALFRSKYCIAAQMNIEYNNTLKYNIQELLIHHLNPSSILHVIKKYSKDILTESNIEKLKCIMQTEGQIKGTIELLDLLSKYNKWFPVLLKCLRDKHIKLAFLVKPLKKIEDDVRKNVFGRSKSIKTSEDIICTSSAKRQHCKFSDAFLFKNNSESNSLSQDPIQESRNVFKCIDNIRTSSQEYSSVNSSKDICLCQLDVVLQEIKYKLDSATEKDFYYILNKLDMLLCFIKNYRHNAKILENIICRFDLPGILIHITSHSLSKDETLGLKMKKIALEIFVYMVGGNSINYMTTVTEQCLEMIQKELNGLHNELLTENIHDKEKLHLLMNIKRDLMLILLKFAKNERCKKLLLTQRWKEILKELLTDKDKLVKDMSLLILAYIYENMDFHNLISETNLRFGEALKNILTHLRFYAVYNIPCSNSILAANAYIEGLAKLVLTEDIVKYMSKLDLLLHVRETVQHLDDEMLYKSYFLLLTNIGILDTKEEYQKDRLENISLLESFLYTSASEVNEQTDVKSGFKLGGEISTKALELKNVIGEGDFATVLKEEYYDHSLKNSGSFESSATDARDIQTEMKNSFTQESNYQNIKNRDTGFQSEDQFSISEKNSYTYYLTIGELSDHLDVKSGFKLEGEKSTKALKLKNVIGEGHFATVWKGLKDQKIIVAVKIMKKQHFAAKSFYNEVKILKQLENPKIVKLLAVVSVKETYCIIMEYMARGNLKTFLQADKGHHLKSDNIFLQICDGMKFVQEKRIVHRDLRAENILVDKNLDLKISDFGIACVLESEESICTELSYSQFPIKWTAPEGKFEKKFSLFSDVWSFGVVMYEVITFGKEPYSGLTSETALQIIQKGEFLKSTNRTFIEEKEFYFDKMVECWNQVPEKRPRFSHLYSYFKNFSKSVA